MIDKILVLCIGNICRSPMAEALLKHRFKTMEKPIEIASAGLVAMVGKPADPMAQSLMLARGIDISSHIARLVTPELLFGSDLIFTMDNGQKTHIERQFQNIRGRVHRLGRWDGFDVVDPYQRGKAVFEQSLALIDQAVESWCEKLGWN